MGLLIPNQQQAYYQGNNNGNYQFASLADIINQFMFVYVGEDKIIPKARRIDVAFHAQRALAELSFDTLKSTKAQEITLPPSLQMILPQDYVNYTKVSWVDSAGIKHLLYPTSKTSNPTSLIQNQNEEGLFKLEAFGKLETGTEKIILTGDNASIVVGMKVEHPYISSAATVIATSTLSGVTTIAIGTLSASGSVNFVISPTNDLTGALLTFRNSDGSLVSNLPGEVVVTTSNNLFLSTDGLSGEIKGVSGVFANVKVGMLVSDANFTIGTTVVNVTDTKVITSSKPIIGGYQNSSSYTQVNFIDNEIYTDSTTWSNYKSQTPSENQDDYQDDTYWPMDGSRYGLDPQHAQANGSFYIDNQSGKIHFSSNVSGKTVILDYISDSLGTDGEMQVHKFAEEAMYKWITHAVLSTSSYGQALVPRLTKDKFAAVRKAKLRLSNIKLEELTQVLRGKSKQIKH